MAEDKTELVNKVIELQLRFGRFMHDEDPDPWLSLNLTIAQLKSLFFINYEKTTSSKNLAAALRVTPPNVTGIIDRLVEQGLVSREYNQQNRRMQILKLTEKGNVLLNDLKVRNTVRYTRLLEALDTEDLSVLVRGLSSLVRVAEKSSGIHSEQDLITE
jgi:MarR family transcriptional regulator, organic hydroperoxide resistance regulator